MPKKIGPYQLSLLETGEFALDGGAMFGVVPKNLWQKTNPADPQNRIDMALRVLLIQADEKNILVDTGIGDKWEEKYQKIYRISHEKYTLDQALASKNVKPDDITDVIISHLHFDHAGGLTYLEDGKLKLKFPNAKIYVQKEQWQWANQPTPKDQASFLKENIIPLKEANLMLLDGEKEIYPGIHILISHGHTKAMQVVKITDGASTVFYAADLIPTSSHVPIPFVMSYDNFPVITMEEKKNILNQAVKENWIICFEHDPKVAAATIQKDLNRERFAVQEILSF